jgi:hypothetical protein
MLCVSVEEALLLLCWKCHDKGFTGKIEPHDKILHGLTHTANDRDSLSPVTLGIFARLKFQGNVEVWYVLRSVPSTNKFADTRLTAKIAFRLNDFKNLMRGVVLFARHVLIET